MDAKPRAMLLLLGLGAVHPVVALTILNICYTYIYSIYINIAYIYSM